MKTASRIWNTMDSANEATEQLNRAERFLTEIQDNPEVITKRNSFVVSFTWVAHAEAGKPWILLG